MVGSRQSWVQPIPFACSQLVLLSLPFLCPCPWDGLFLLKWLPMVDNFQTQIPAVLLPLECPLLSPTSCGQRAGACRCSPLDSASISQQKDPMRSMGFWHDASQIGFPGARVDGVTAPVLLHRFVDEGFWPASLTLSLACRHCPQTEDRLCRSSGCLQSTAYRLLHPCPQSPNAGVTIGKTW